MSHDVPAATVAVSPACVVDEGNERPRPRRRRPVRAARPRKIRDSGAPASISAGSRLHVFFAAFSAAKAKMAKAFPKLFFPSTVKEHV